jgi:hypothetical protein
VRSVPLLGIVTPSRSAYRATNQYGGPMRYIVMAMVMVLACLDLITAQAAVTPGERASLAGLPGVKVVIDEIKSDAQADGLSEEGIRTAVELILRSNGIRVLTQSEWLTTPSGPYLYVTVNPMKSKTGSYYAVGTIIQLNQRVSLVHRPEHTMAATTYEMSGVGIYGTQLLRSLISDVIEPYVKTFANDFLAVNPR